MGKALRCRVGILRYHAESAVVLSSGFLGGSATLRELNPSICVARIKDIPLKTFWYEG